MSEESVTKPVGGTLILGEAQRMAIRDTLALAMLAITDSLVDNRPVDGRHARALNEIIGKL